MIKAQIHMHLESIKYDAKMQKKKTIQLYALCHS